MKKIMNKLNAALLRARIALDNKRAEGFVDSGIKILVAIVVGSLLLAGLYALFGDTMFIVGVWMMTGFIAAAGIVAYFVERRLAKQMHRHMCGIGIVLPCLFMALLFACCPNPLLVVKGFIFTMILYYASAQDIHKREVDDYIPVMIAITSFVGFNRENVFAMLSGAFLTALPLFAAAYFTNGRVGGADIKLMAAAGLLLGAEKGLVALMIGLLLGVTATFIYRKIKKASMTEAFPLVPYLSAGCFLAYLL